MGLQKVSSTTVTTSTAQVILTGINTDDVYLFAWSGVTCSNDVDTNQIRVTKSGTAQSDSEYDRVEKQYFAGSSFVNGYAVNQTSIFTLYQGTGQNESQNGLIYLHDFNSGTDYSYMTREQVSNSYVPQLQGFAGGAVHTVASASDGIEYKMSVGTLQSGTFTLYRCL